MRKSIRNMVLADVKRIHWRKYLSRKVWILALFGAVGYLIEHSYHLWWAGKGGEVLTGVLVEHLFMEVPMVEEIA